MNEYARRVTTARSLMWEAASSDEQAAWLRCADEVLAELTAAAEIGTWRWPDNAEGEGA